MIGRWIEDIIINIFYFLFSGMIWLMYQMGNIISKIFEILKAVFSSDIFHSIYISISIAVAVFLFMTVVYNFFIAKVNDSPEERTNRIYVKTIFSGIVLIFVPQIVNAILRMFQEISTLIFSFTGSNNFGELMLSTVISISSTPTDQTRTISEITSDLIASYNGIATFSPTLRVNDVIQYPVNWFVAGVISILFFILLFLIAQKVGDKLIESFELYLALPVATLSFTKEGGVLFTRTLFAIISAFVSLLLVEMMFTLIGMVIATVKEEFGGFAGFLILLILLIYALKKRSKISEILEADGNVASSGTLQQMIGRGVTSATNTTIGAVSSGMGMAGKGVQAGVGALGSTIGAGIGGTMLSNIMSENMSSSSNSNSSLFNGGETSLLTSATHGQLTLGGPQSTGDRSLPGHTQLEGNGGVMLLGYNTPNLFNKPYQAGNSGNYMNEIQSNVNGSNISPNTLNTISNIERLNEKPSGNRRLDL